MSLTEEPFKPLAAVATAEVYRVTIPGAEEGFLDRLRLTVEHRGEGRWAVCRNRECMDADGVWDFDSSESRMDEDFLRAYRHELAEALALAKKWAERQLPIWREWDAERTRRNELRQAADARQLTGREVAIGVAQVPASVDESTTVEVEEVNG